MSEVDSFVFGEGGGGKMMTEQKVGIVQQEVKQLGVTAFSSYINSSTIPIIHQNRVTAQKAESVCFGCNTSGCKVV